MLGLIYTLIISIGLIIHWSKEKKENIKCKTLYKHKDGLTYTDFNGRSRLLNDDTLVFYTHNKNGDYILEDASGNVYKNFSEEKREKKLKKTREELINNKNSTYCISEDNHKKDWICKGKRFSDIKTGDIYVIRYINGKYYYMNVQNGILVRKTDWQIKKDSETILDCCSGKGVDIDTFNERQAIIKDKSLLYRDYEYNSLCDYYK